MGWISYFKGMRKIKQAYDAVCKNVCKDFDLAPQSLGILMTLANDESVLTAKNIGDINKLKPNLISFHVDKLVNAGYIERLPIDGNRRAIKLALTDKAQPVIERGKKAQAEFTALITRGISEAELALMKEISAKIDKNADGIIAEQNI